MFALDAIIICSGYGVGKYSSEVGVKVNPIHGDSFVILGKLLSNRPVYEDDLQKPLKRVFSKKTRSYYYLLED